MYNVRIRAYRAIDDPASCLRFAEGHMKVLEIYGITKITSARNEWFTNPDVYVIQAESPDGEKVYGGARIQIANKLAPLPIETAIGDIDRSIYPLIQEYAEFKTGELCGLWNSREVAGLGIGSVYLTRTVVSIINQLKLSSLFALCAPYVVPKAQESGFSIVESLGDHGTFFYPKEGLIATAVVLLDPEKLSCAEESERNAILALRNCPEQVLVDNNGSKGPVEITFELKLPDLIKEYAYEPARIHRHR